jgi:rhodanese-related sulfurtransferase
MRSLILRQAALVLLLGTSFAAMANHFSPRGLSLSQNYFPAAVPTAAPAPPENPGIPTKTLIHEFATASRADVESFLSDPRFVTRKFLLIDARNLANYQSGHIPGALQYDHYRPTENISPIISACTAAEKIILYCHGGHCEDSIFTARLLVGYGIPATRLAIYEKGIDDWRAAALPLQH